MASYKIVYDKGACIGAGECEALSPELWKMLAEGKAELKGGKAGKGGAFELVISEEQYQKQRQVAGNCPAGCIRVEKA